MSQLQSFNIQSRRKEIARAHASAYARPKPEQLGTFGTNAKTNDFPHILSPSSFVGVCTRVCRAMCPTLTPPPSALCGSECHIRMGGEGCAPLGARPPPPMPVHAVFIHRQLCTIRRDHRTHPAKFSTFESTYTPVRRSHRNCHTHTHTYIW